MLKTIRIIIAKCELYHSAVILQTTRSYSYDDQKSNNREKPEVCLLILPLKRINPENGITHLRRGFDSKLFLLISLLYMLNFFGWNESGIIRESSFYILGLDGMVKSLFSGC